ncbi:MAG: hypothetical protein HYS57_01530 [Parcubacteria group bacterium]|nr:hypothetical protein [Parcubacteria group bacterium]
MKPRIISYQLSVISLSLIAGILGRVPAVLAHGKALSEGWGIVACPADKPCLSFCDLAHTAQHFLQLLIDGSVLIAVIIVLYGAFQMIISAGNASMFASGKKAVTYAIVGVIVVYVAWIVVNTIMVAFANQGAFPWPWHEIHC